MEISLASDNIDPARENWREADDAQLWHAAKAGIPQAVAEAKRRRLM